MKIAIVLAAFGLGLGPSTFSPCASAYSDSARAGCCKVCAKGKACGDSCIARDKTCHKGRGCACDG